MWKWIKNHNPFGPDNLYSWMRDELEAARREGRRVQALLAGALEELAAIIEATERDGCDTALEAVKQLRQQTDTLEWREAYSDDAFKALIQERDELKAEIAQHIAWQEAMVMDIAHVRAERDAFRAKLQRVTDHNQTITEGYKAEIAALRERASVPSVAPTDDQVEALARVLRAAPDKWWPALDETWDRVKDMYIDQARAAIAHLSTRPEGLPTAEELRAAHLKYVEGYRKGENDGSQCATDFALEYLTPFLRQSVGWELDIRPGMLRDSVALHSEESFLKWLRSRIRPVYECKECERRRNMIPQIIADVTAAAAGATRAALEANP